MVKGFWERKEELSKELTILVVNNGHYIDGKRVVELLEEVQGCRPEQADLDFVTNFLGERGYKPSGRGYKLEL